MKTLKALMLVLALTATLALTGCQHNADSGKPRVVTTTAILADLVRQISGDKLRVNSIVPPGADPHTFEPSLRISRDIAYADAAFSNYLLLEPHSVIKTLDSTLRDGVPNISVAEESTKYGAEVIPLVESSHLDTLWLGLRARGSQTNRSAEIEMKLAGATGPGSVYGYVTSTFGSPQRFFESRDANGGQPVLLPVGAHTHMSWAFTEPGTYQLTFQATKDGQLFAEETVNFAVGVPASKTAISQGHADIAADLDTSEIYLWVDESGGGDATQKRVDPQNVVLEVPNRALLEIPASAQFRFLGQPGDLIYQLPQAVLGAHVHGEIDPHMWLSVPNTKAYVRTITETLVKVSPMDASYFRENEAKYLAELDELDQEVMDKIATIPESNRHLVTTHDAYSYFAKRYGLDVAGYVSANPEVEPSIADRARLSQTLRNLGTPAVFVEPAPAESTAVLRQVAEENGIKVCTIYSDTLDERVPSYVELMRFNANSVADCLGGG